MTSRKKKHFRISHILLNMFAIGLSSAFVGLVADAESSPAKYLIGLNEILREPRSTQKDEEMLEAMKTYKNPRNVPSGDCPRDEVAAHRMGRTCLRKCSSDPDCSSKKKVCLCDGICGMSCIKPDKECGELVNPMFGFVEVNGRIVGSKARYKCQKGYHLIGSDERICQADGSWSRTPPECRENRTIPHFSTVYCTDPPKIPHAKHDSPEALTRYEVNHTLQYSCNQGYNTKGFSVAKCFLYNGTMQWFGPKIKCSPISCGDPGDILNGYKDGTCFKFSCRVTYHCRPGFELIGRTDYFCQHDGMWSPKELPTCKAVQCDTPDNPENGKVIYTTKSYNSVVTYECSYGYMIVGSSTRRCGPDKKWTGDKPKCKEINCGSPGHLPNGWLENMDKGTSLGASIIFRCLPNMTLEGEDTSVCQSDGAWSKPLPKCLAPCIVPTIEHGEVNNTKPREKVLHGFQLNVTCDDTFELAFGSVPPTCFNGTWSRYPRCKPARCKELPERPRHGIVIVPKSDHGMKARYRCKDGYKLEGPERTECRFGNWTGEKPICKEVYCPFPGTVKYGRVLLVGNMGMYDYRDYVQKVKNNRQIRYKCDRGFYLVDGPPGATCVAGRWSPDKLPSCKPDLHPRMKWIKKRSANFSALLNSEENVSTDVLITPTIHRHASYPNESEENQPTIDIHSVTMDRHDFDDHLKHVSVFPRRLWGSTSGLDSSEEDVENDEEGAEEEEDKEEEEVDDDKDNENEEDEDNSKDINRNKEVGNVDTDIKELISAEMMNERIRKHRLKKRELSNNKKKYTKRETLSKEERKRLRMERREMRKMNKRRKKGFRGRAFAHCEEINEEVYMKIEILRPGRDDNYTFSSGARLKVTCLHGYGLNIGNKTAKCARGRWKPMKPECFNLPCTIPPTDHGEFEYNGHHVHQDSTISHGEVVKFSCLPGFNVVGSDTMRCWYGEWAVTGKNPECHPMSCVLPEILHGRYDSGYKQNLTIMHGASVEYTCDSGWSKSIPDVRCHIGLLQPSPPHCVRNIVNTVTIANNVKRSEPLTGIQETAKPEPLKATESPHGRTYQDSELSTGKDITVMGITTQVEKEVKMCPPPQKIPNTSAFKNGSPLAENDAKFPEGTNYTVECVLLYTSNMGEGEVIQWNLRCENGIWTGSVLGTCENGDDGNYGNKTCIWRKEDQKVVSFYNDQELTNHIVELPPGAKLYSRCEDIGKYMITGSVLRKCKNGKWTGDEPACQGLSQVHNYALDKPPTILIRHYRGPIAQSNDGKLVVYPGTTLHLECLWVRRYGTPRWNVSQTITEMDPKKKRKKKKKVKSRKKGGAGLKIDRKYPEGWTTDPNRNRQLEYRLSLYKAKKEDSGSYICTTPTMTQHIIMVDVKAVHCPNVIKTAGLHINPNSTKMSTEVQFNCDPGSMLVGANSIRCKPSGNWSAPLPHCEKVRCKSPVPPKNGRVEGEGPYHAGDMVQISCQPNYMMEGHPMIVCQQDGNWSGEVARCLEACTYPGTIISGTMSSVKFYYGVGDTITYTCSEGFTLHGSREIECLDGARWSGPVPSCLPKP